ncbi:MAG: DUF3040 domain-containing protein [Mycobacteriales bacterium]|nr:DUF3040 domain-containing protein [Frankia sp.]
MPLSEHEQQLLDQIERALYAEDPKFASAVRATDLKNYLRRRIWRSAAMFVVGIVVLVVGVAVQGFWLVGVAGFALMLVASLVVWRSVQRLHGGADAAAADPRPQPSRVRPHESWTSRIEERWKRRWDDRDR